MIIYIPPGGKEETKLPYGIDAIFYNNTVIPAWSTYKQATHAVPSNATKRAESFLEYLQSYIPLPPLLEGEELPATKTDTCIIVWGRFQPPHKGHGKLYDTAVVLGDEQYKKEIIDKYAYGKDIDHHHFGSLTETDDKEIVRALTNELDFIQSGNADVFIMPTNTCDTGSKQCKNPLHILQKFKILNTIYPDPKYRFAFLDINNLTDVLPLFRIYKNMVMVCGEDRYKDYVQNVEKYFIKRDQGKKGTAYAPAGEGRFPIKIEGQEDQNLSASLIRKALELCLKDIVKQGLMPDARPEEYQPIDHILQSTIIGEKGNKKDIQEINCETNKTNRATLIRQLLGQEDEEKDKVIKEKTHRQSRSSDVKIISVSPPSELGPFASLTAAPPALTAREIRSLNRAARLAGPSQGGAPQFLFIKNFMKKLYGMFP